MAKLLSRKSGCAPCQTWRYISGAPGGPEPWNAKTPAGHRDVVLYTATESVCYLRKMDMAAKLEMALNRKISPFSGFLRCSMVVDHQVV